MSSTTAPEKPAAQAVTEAPKRNQQVARLAPPRLPYHPAIEETFGVSRSQWKALTESLFPLAKTTDAICLALSYCKARNLDIMKKPVHIVPMWNGELKREVETVWPAITEHRITAHRTGQYAGTDKTEFGPMKTQTFKATVTKGKQAGKKIEATVTFPEYAEVTVYRLVGGKKMAFPGPRVYFLEFYGMMMGLPVPNARWQRSPSQMLEKCAEAGALRKAFTEELGSEPVAEEMEGRIIKQIMDKINTGDPRPARTAGTGDFRAENEVHEEPDASSAPPAQAGAEPSEDAIVEGEDEIDGEEVAAEHVEVADVVLPANPPVGETVVTENKTAQPATVQPPARETITDPKEIEYLDYKQDAWEKLQKATLTRTVDDLQTEILPNLREEDKEKFIAACNARARAIAQGGKK